jgi:dienelactone hydrolase
MPICFRSGFDILGRVGFDRAMILALMMVLTIPFRILGDGSQTNAPAGFRGELQFQTAAPYATLAEFGRRLGFAGVPSSYAIADEKFRVVVPDLYSTNGSWGLFVWISPSNEARLPADYEEELGRRRLLLVAPLNGGNDRPSVDRVRLALDATCNMCRRYKVNYQRVYVGGFSGGSRIASVLGVAYADIFGGTLCLCGADFYQNVPAAAGGYYLAGYKPDPGLVLRAKKSGRFALVTGENDMNRDNTKSTADHGFKANNFNYCLYLEVPAMQHALPSATVFGSALKYLDDPAPGQTK